jgi:hypothetical protein
MLRISKRIKEKETSKLNNTISSLNIKIQELNNNTTNINYLVFLLIEIYSIFLDNYDLMDRYKYLITKLNTGTLMDTGKYYIEYFNHNISCVDNKIFNKFKKMYLKFLEISCKFKKGMKNLKYDEKECPICFEMLTEKNVVIPVCENAICFDCIVKCEVCPICRQLYQP